MDSVIFISEGEGGVLVVPRVGSIPSRVNSTRCCGNEFRRTGMLNGMTETACLKD